MKQLILFIAFILVGGYVFESATGQDFGFRRAVNSGVSFASNTFSGGGAGGFAGGYGAATAPARNVGGSVGGLAGGVAGALGN